MNLDSVEIPDRIGPINGYALYLQQMHLDSPRKWVLLDYKWMRNPNDWPRANELTNVIRAQIEQGMNWADAVYTRVAELYKNWR